MKKIIPLVVATSVCVQAEGWERSLTGTISTQEGNTNLTSYALAFSSEYVGDVKLGRAMLRDSEVKFAVSHKRGQLNDAIYEHDGSASFLLDVMAHQTFSPFLLSHWAYDSTTSLERRTQIGLGAKYRLPRAPAGLSISLAYVWEVQEYNGKGAESQFRWSLRPKFKKTFSGGISVNYLIFTQPLADDFSDYLIDSQLILSIPTQAEGLKITFTWLDKYNSRPPEGVEKSDTDLNVGITLSF